MSNRVYYVICEDNCKFESMTKGEILTAIEEAVEEHGTRPIQAEFVESVIDINSNLPLFLWLGTQAEYDRLLAKMTNTLYIIAEHHAEKQTILTAIQTAFSGLEALDLDELENSLNAVNDDFETAKNKRLQTKADLSAAISDGQSITNAVAGAESKQSEFASQISGFEAVLPSYKTNAENHLENRGTITELWSGTQVVSSSGTEITLNDSVSGFDRVLIELQYQQLGQRCFIFFENSGVQAGKCYFIVNGSTLWHLFVTADFSVDEKITLSVSDRQWGNTTLLKVYGIGGNLNGNS